MSLARILAPRSSSPSLPPSLPLVALCLALASAGACNRDQPTTIPDESTPPVDTAPAATKPAIDAARMLGELQYLSSDELRGRFTFSPELAVAADHLVKTYRAAGIAPVGDDYLVPFTAPAGSKPGDELTVWIEDAKGGSRQVAGKEITTLGNGKGEAVYAEAVGLEALARAKPAQVRGKIVVAPAPSGDLVAAVTAVAEHGAKGLVLVGDAAPDPATTRGPLGELSLPVAWVSPATAKEWMAIEVTGKGAPKMPERSRISMAAKNEPIEEQAHNVVAYIPGQTHPEQIVVLGAHYDHIGVTEKGLMCREQEGDTICNGADDNGSGTAMVLEIARAFVDAHVRPDRTVVFAHFAGEELGLHGSAALASKPPAVPPFEGGQVVAMVNLDMVGRLGDEGLAIGGVSSSDAWMPLLDELGSRGLPIVYERAINGRSDHANYYREDVPVLFFFTGLHDDYHEVGDEFERINGEGMADIAQLVADLVAELASGRDVPFTPPRTDGEGVVSHMPGAQDSTVEKRVGVSVEVEKKEP